MITKDELREYSKLSALNLGQAEKDYFQNVILFILYQEFGNEIVFKGGTALKKCFGLDRFSEDLDFACMNEMNTKKIEDGLKRFGLEFEIETRNYDNELKIDLKIRGPLYIGLRQSLCRLIVDFSYRESVILKPLVLTIGRFMKEIPAFDVVVMQEAEILAEKIRAVMTRTKARDVYDVWYMLVKGVEFKEDLVKEKLKFYGKEWNPKEFEKSISMKKSIWKTELESLVRNLPDFGKAEETIIEGIRK